LVGDAVAIEIARSAVGGICLALSVPLTTGIAELLARPFGTPKPSAPARKVKAGRRTDTGSNRAVPRPEGSPETGPRRRAERAYRPWPTTGDQPRVRRPGPADPRTGPRAATDPRQPSAPRSPRTGPQTPGRPPQGPPQ